VASTAAKYDLYSDAFRADTYATFARMREHDPVVRQAGIDGETPIWWVTRYEDAEAVLLDDERFVRDPRLAVPPELLPELPELFRVVDSNMLNGVSAAGEMELVSAFAFPLPITVIAELLGVSAADRESFREWSGAMVSPALAAAEMERADALMGAFVQYLLALFAERREAPGDDLVSALVAVEDGGDTLSEEELCSMVALLIVAGHETTVSLIGNAMRALLTHPEQRAVIERDPSLLPGAVEELIRYDGPVERTLNRWAAVDVELRGRKIRRGETVIVVLGAADHDPERFTEPDTLDLAAERETRHLGFGRGRHFCLGAPLARLEAEIALGTLLRRLPGLRLAVPPEELRWRPVPLFRSLVALPVAWDA
jgi:cytochrome P450